MKCNQCGAEAPANAKFCSECGADLSQGSCPQCSEPIRPGARFCHNCGAQVSEQTVTAAASGGVKQEEAPKKNWVFLAGVLVSIPVVFLIVALLFWKNQEPGPLNASDRGSSQGAPSMAAMQDVHQTLERLKQRVEENPRDLVAIDSLAAMFAIAGSHAKAANYYEMHLEVEPDNAQVKIALGLTYHNMQRSSDGITLIQEVLAKEPTNAFALFYVAEIYAETGNKDEAAANWQKIVDTYPGTEMANMAQQRIHEFTHADSEASN